MRRDQYGNVSEGNAGVCLRVWVSIVSLLQVRSSSAVEGCWKLWLGERIQASSVRGPWGAQLKHVEHFLLQSPVQHGCVCTLPCLFRFHSFIYVLLCGQHASGSDVCSFLGRSCKH